MEKKLNKVAAYWDERGNTYTRSWQSVAKKRLSRLETNLVENAIEQVRSNAKKKAARVLDIGIAIGRVCDAILKHDVELYGTDISKTMVDYCKEKYKGNKKAKEFKIHDIHEPLPKTWGKFDVVSAFRVLAYTPHLQKQLEMINNSMEKGGILVFTYPNKYSSVFISKLVSGKNRLGDEMSLGEIKEAIKKAGFSRYRVVGFSRLLDTFYDKSNGTISTTVLFTIEKLLSLIFGKTLFARLFYITCKK